LQREYYKIQKEREIEVYADNGANLMKNKSRGFSLDFLSGQYDLLTPAERSRFRRRQVALMELSEGEQVLDVGCGTGSLSILARMAVGDTGQVSGVDIAPKMIRKAHQKAGRYKLEIDFQCASIAGLPFPDERFDVVSSSLMFHHLPVPIKREGLREIYRVMKRNGRFFLADFCTPSVIAAPLMFLLLIWLRSTRYQLLGRLPGLIAEAGFSEAKLVKNGLLLKYFIIRKG
jgi:ubiquinone/menaquinone biosynthesis C-methylase UbiE